MSLPKLTIISAVRHDQSGLDLTIASISAECPWAEHLILDGSDVPLHLAASQAQLRSVYGRDSGISHAFNRGVMAAQGEYLMFVNAGDSLVLGAGHFLHMALQPSTADCVWFPVYRCQPDGTKTTYSPRLEWLKYAMSAPHQGMVVRRDVFAEIGLFPLQRYAMDHHLALRLIHRRPSYRIDCPKAVIANYPAGGHSTKGGAKPFITNCWNVARLSLGDLPMALLANAYLATKAWWVGRIMQPS